MREDQRVVGDGHPIPDGNEIREIGVTNYIEAYVTSSAYFNAAHFQNKHAEAGKWNPGHAYCHQIPPHSRQKEPHLIFFLATKWTNSKRHHE
jgi:hypothetical protein